jgi:hypothetical protein
VCYCITESVLLQMNTCGTPQEPLLVRGGRGDASTCGTPHEPFPLQPAVPMNTCHGQQPIAVSVSVLQPAVP